MGEICICLIWCGCSVRACFCALQHNHICTTYIVTFSAGLWHVSSDADTIDNRAPSITSSCFHASFNPADFITEISGWKQTDRRPNYACLPNRLIDRLLHFTQWHPFIPSDLC